MGRSGRPPLAFTIFGISMAAVLVISTIVVFGGAVFGGTPDSPDQTIPTPDRRDAEEVQRLRTAVAEDPDDIDSAAVLANILANQGQIQESLSLYDRAVNARPEDYDLRLAFGIALYRAGHSFDAKVQLREAHELQPDSAAPAFYLGQVFENQESPDLNKAREWYETAMELEPDSMVGGQAEQRLNEISDLPTPTPES